MPRYLNELRSDLKTMVANAENGEITEGVLKSIARDAYFIKEQLNVHLDQLLKQAGQPVRKSLFLQSCQPHGERASYLMRKLMRYLSNLSWQSMVKKLCRQWGREDISLPFFVISKIFELELN